MIKKPEEEKIATSHVIMQKIPEVVSKLCKSCRPKRPRIDGRLFAGNQVGHQFSRCRGGGQTDHAVTGGDK
jgi:hypothetical protein